MNQTKQLYMVAAIIMSYLREIAGYVKDKARAGEKGAVSFFLYVSDCLGIVTDWIFDREAEALAERRAEK